jgi:hypothetical protein
LIDEAGIEVALLEIRIGQDFQEEPDIRFDALNVVFAKRTLHSRYGFGSSRTQVAIRDERIVINRNRQPSVYAAVVAHSWPDGSRSITILPGGRKKLFSGLPRKHGIRPPRRASERRLGQAKAFSRRYGDLKFDEIQSGDQFCNRVLDLKPRVHFEKVKAPLSIDEDSPVPAL